jgi:hypothetical protein
MSRFLLAALFTVAVILSAPADANQINTADATGAYHTSFCPRLSAQLRQAKFAYECATSEGTGENLRRVIAEPRQIGFGQLDILALDGALAPGSPIVILRNDDVRECLFAVARNKDIGSWSDISVGAAKLRFMLPPAQSGSASTFRYLQQLDRSGLGQANSITHAASTDDAIRLALSADDTVTLFVQVPDPDNARFRLVVDLGGRFIPVIDREILRPQVNGRKIYFAQETQVANANWTSAGVKLITACTPLTIFTGAPERITAGQARQDHEDLIATIRAFKPEALLPTETAFSRFLKRTKELSASSTERLLDLSERARKEAAPYIDRAKEAGDKALEAAKPTLDRAKEIGEQILERSREEARGLRQTPEEQKK